MYLFFLFVHSWVRWIVVLLLLVVLFKFLTSLLQSKQYSKIDRILSSLLLGFVHLQFLIGVVLYFALSPLVRLGLADIKTVMKNTTLRYWTVEHIASMFIFTVLIQIGFSTSKRAVESASKHKKMLIGASIAFFVLMATIPWPMREYGRALFRF